MVAGADGAVSRAQAAILAACGLTVVAVDRNEHALGDLPDTVRREVPDTDPPVAPRLTDRIAGEAGPTACC
jgi:NADP-dependent 3-hydroxy acid dehydrogenase YdfG